MKILLVIILVPIFYIAICVILRCIEDGKKDRKRSKDEQKGIIGWIIAGVIALLLLQCLSR